MKKLLGRFLLLYQRLFFSFNFIKDYKWMLRINKIEYNKNKKEKEWVKKWSQLGMKAHPAYYRVFSHYIGEDINIVPEDVCHVIIEPILNPYFYETFYDDKNNFDVLFPSGFMPETLLRKINGFYYDKEHKRLNVSDDLIEKIHTVYQANKIIIKPTVGGGSGRKIQMFHFMATNETNGYHDVCSNEKLTTHFLDKYDDNFIIQRVVQQSDYLAQFNSTSINTLRMVVYKSVRDDECHVLAAILRIGGNGSVVDNTHSGGKYIGINQDGTFCHKVFNDRGESFDSFNGIDFANNYKYPNWDNVIAFAKNVGKRIIHHRLLALDIALDTNNNPVLIEFNSKPTTFSMWLFQFTVGPAFGEWTDEILEYCYNNLSRSERLTVNF